jgi:alpha-N-acetylglucosaminidase
MCRILMLVLVLIVPDSHARAQGQNVTQPVMDMLKRVVGMDVATQFDLSLNPSMAQGFTASTTGEADATNGGMRIAVVASGLPELAYGCGYYLRTEAGMSFAWERNGGNQVRVPEGGLPPLSAPVSLTKKAKWTYYQNVCTQSYSMWWWDWGRWERELDWAALWGVNLVLAYTGQEEIFRTVYNSIGVNDSVLNATFDGPAFLTWSRGQGTFGVGGPLPDYWIKSQHALQIKIMARIRLLGMKGVLPGFQGNVPLALPSLFPAANTSGGWLDALDPLFRTIAHEFAAGVKEDFGATGFVEADGWFSLETGPWLGASAETGGGGVGVDGMDAARPRHPRAKTAGPRVGTFSEATITEADGARAAGSDNADGGFGGCLNGFVVPTEEEAFTRARAVFAAITDADPEATWVYQGYPWFRVYSQGSACNQTALREFVRGFTRAVPKDRLLVLDLVADSPGRALWRYPVDPALGPFAQNASLVWCALNNWGGAVHLGGDIEYVLSETRAAMARPEVTGVGLTPEGIDTSAPYFSLVIDSPWTPQPTAEAWLAEWGAGRCGRKGVKPAEEAYALLYQTVYRPGQPYLWCCSQPRFCPTVHPGERGGVARPSYNTTLLRRALELLVEAAEVEGGCDTEAFRFDIVDVGREWLSMAPCLAALDNVSTTASSTTAAELRAQVAALREVHADVDAMMATDEGFLLGAWLRNSRKVAEWDGSAEVNAEQSAMLADFYEWNSRVQVSTWAGGYSRREWSGMVGTYYSERTAIWLNYTLQSRADGSTTTAAAAATAATAAATAVGRSNEDVSLARRAPVPAPAGYRSFPNRDCNFDDLKHITDCPASPPATAAAAVACLARECNSTAGCLAFNYPGKILKKVERARVCTR